MKIHTLAKLAILTAIALILGFLDSLLSGVVMPVPGMKLGLSNVAILYAVFFMSPVETAILMLLKVGLSMLLFSNPFGALYSLAGGVLSVAGMRLLRLIPKISPIPVSTVGGILHIIGQCLIGFVLFSIRPVLFYAPWLLICGTVTGVLLGILSDGVFKGLDLYNRRCGV
ncbi:MAG: Gx transporter family protein [Clostridia bacterium]|nr:Gx transporter family protein [Clostridia bacterium]